MLCASDRRFIICGWPRGRHPLCERERPDRDGLPNRISTIDFGIVDAMQPEREAIVIALPHFAAVDAEAGSGKERLEDEGFRIDLSRAPVEPALEVGTLTENPAYRNSFFCRHTKYPTNASCAFRG